MNRAVVTIDRVAISRTRKAVRPAIIAGLAILGAATAFLAYIGYLGGSVFITMPATARPEGATGDTAAILLSGDMGFSMGMGPQIAKRLAARGIPVIGVNSLAYFRTERTPAEAQKLVVAATQKALALPGVRRVILIGQSFGADQLQAALPALPQALRDKVPLVILVVPSDTIAYRASPSEIFSSGVAEVPSLPTARQLTWTPAMCVHGAKETNSLCPLLHLPNVEQATLPGGHPLRRDANRLFETIMPAIERAAGK